MIQTAQRLQGINEYYFAQKLAQISKMDATYTDKVINLGIGSPDMLPDEGVISSLQEASQHLLANKYQSYIGLPELRNSFAKYYQDHFGVRIDSNNQILPLLGSKEGIMHLSMTYLQSGDACLIPNPGYPAYTACTKIAGATPANFDLKPSLGYLPDLDQLSRQDLSSVKMMWLNYPNMPTGAVANIDFFNELSEWAKSHQILVCHDNPYTFILNDNPLSILQASEAMPWMLELTSLSKNFHMAGWRVGAMVADASIVREVLKFKSNMDSGMYMPIQMAAVAALGLGKEWFERINQAYASRKEKAKQIMGLLGCSIEASEAGMFVWARTPQHTDGDTLSEHVLQVARVFITPGHIFGDAGNQYLRISLCSDEDTFDEAINRIQQAI